MKFSQSIQNIFANKDITVSLAKRDLEARFRGSVLGILWIIIMPILILLVYSFVFGVIFRAKWGIDEGDGTQYSLILFAGLIVFNIFADCVSRAPTLITGNVSYVKKVVFPLEILPVTAIVVALCQAFVSLIVWFIAHLILYGFPPLTCLLFPVIMLPYVLFILGVSWFLASVGVFLRDVSQVIAILVTILLFMSPIFYPVSVVPEAFRMFYGLNPITYAVEMSRGVLFFGRLPGVLPFISFTIISVIIASLGFYWFQGTRKGFADVL